MKKQKSKRWRLFADKKVQGQLCIRMVLYWAICQISLLGTIGLFSFITNFEAPITPLVVPAFIVSLLFLPIVLLDVLVFSNRFAGPMVNLRINLKKILRGEQVNELRFRPGDFYQNICNDFNLLREKQGATENTRLTEANCGNSDSSSNPALIVSTTCSTSEMNAHV